jgi:hypothetical protein
MGAKIAATSFLKGKRKKSILPNINIISKVISVPVPYLKNLWLNHIPITSTLE